MRRAGRDRSATASASAASVAALGSLGKDVAQLGVVAVLVRVMHSDVPLEVVGSGVAMLLVWAEGANGGSVSD